MAVGLIWLNPVPTYAICIATRCWLLQWIQWKVALQQDIEQKTSAVTVSILYICGRFQ